MEKKDIEQIEKLLGIEKADEDTRKMEIVIEE
jgi:hypothetical protein